MRKTILFLFLFITYSIQAQVEISGLIIDKITLIPISNASILDIKTGQKVLSNELGKFEMISSGNIEISFTGYQSKIITTLEKQYLIIPIETKVNELQEVFINTQSIPLQKKYATDAITILNAQDINRGNTIELHPILNKVPGVLMQNGTLNTNRITIRGIGARNLFGTANIRTYFGDIPLTDGNGESSIEDLELGSISRIDIHKGPSSSSYGVGLGGTILLRPELITNKGIETSLSTSLGSYGLVRNVAKIAIGGKRSSINVLYSNNHSDGYRDNNQYTRNTATITSSLYLGEKNDFSIIASYVDLKAGIPSSLGQDDFENNPRQAAFTWGQSQAFEDVTYGIFGFSWKHQYNASFSQYTSLFTSLRKNYEPRPFNILEEKSNSVGIRSRLVHNSRLFDKKWDWTAGGELFFDFYTGKTFDNLYQDFPIGTGSIRGDQLSDLDERRNYYNLFAASNLSITDKLKINMGIHLNQTFFNVEDNFLEDGDDSSGKFEFEPILSPKIGVNYALNTNVIFFGNVAHGFSTPTTSETLLPDGEFNPEIQPEIGWNYEIGTRYNLMKNRLYGSFSLYTLKVKDLLVTRRTEEDNFFAINAGKTTHTGVEGTINYQLIKSSKKQLNLQVSGTLNNYKFDDFVDLDDDFSGNKLTGTPSHVINFGMDYMTKKGIYGNLNFQIVGSIPANDSNTIFSDQYELLNGKIGYANLINKHISFDLFLGMNNILDKRYASQLQINATGFGGSQPRYFYPGLPFNMYGGINIKYRI
ncbi:TonB-dependent receptor [Aquimarina sp. Aq107]|uniref:TonB-dependent receptor n=1 Tax=Aquimarina sp. Aq107 TaxID=1191912 RepID=UPI000D55A200|nr:TonB-dependent receptor [Aquimarina sp. Aq107]